MFYQFRPWLDCDRKCPFCYIDEKDRMSDKDKMRSLMKLASFMSEITKGSDTVGIIGGELFQDDRFFHEWICLAETIHSADHIKRLFIGTHLLGDVDFMLEWCDMLNKEVQICTSYDTEGRFNEGEYEKWIANIKKVQDAGYKVVCSTTLTDAFMHDTRLHVPEGVDFKLQPIFISEGWLENEAKKCSEGADYNADLRLGHNDLAKREDVLRWFNAHKDIAKDYSVYSDKHASALWDFDKEHGEYYKKGFVCSNYVAKCGHPMIAYCYADSCKCSMCDAREISDV